MEYSVKRINPKMLVNILNEVFHFLNNLSQKKKIICIRQAETDTITVYLTEDAASKKETFNCNVSQHFGFTLFTKS